MSGPPPPQMKDKEMRPVHTRRRLSSKDFMRCPFNVKLRIAVDPSFQHPSATAATEKNFMKYSLFYVSVPFERLKALELPAEGRRAAGFCRIPLSQYSFFIFSR
ncbi:hypothetical protein CDAR_240261 [Caerostris darwini]|uniref:Uncharacterized protein n=1 Tax=Caerostris darwini TaxID=1538125 RepID=A0AAV4QBM5_9ARAC|nr:hypothetical protein CDAR_240261 [Caerostris darwini]